MTNRYTLCFAFDITLQQVVLVRKSKPAGLVGLLNGVGGKFTNAEGYYMGMARELREETGLDVSTADLKMKSHVRMRSVDAEIFLFSTTLTEVQLQLIRDRGFNDAGEPLIVADVSWARCLPTALYSNKEPGVPTLARHADWMLAIARDVFVNHSTVSLE